MSSFLSDSDIDMAALGLQDNGDYIPDKKSSFTPRATARDIDKIEGDLLPGTLTAAMAANMRQTATDAANSLGLFSERTMWSTKTTAAFLSRLYGDDYDKMAKAIGGEAQLASSFEAKLADLYLPGKQLSPLEMSIGITYFEREVLGEAKEDRTAIPQPRDFMDIPYLTLKQYSRAVWPADLQKRIQAVNQKLA